MNNYLSKHQITQSKGDLHINELLYKIELCCKDTPKFRFTYLCVGGCESLKPTDLLSISNNTHFRQ